MAECRRRPCAVAANLCLAGKQALSSLDNCYRGEFLANSPSAAATSSHRISVVALPSNESVYVGDRLQRAVLPRRLSGSVEPA